MENNYICCLTHLLIAITISILYASTWRENEVLKVQRVASGSFSLILDLSFLFFHRCSDYKCYFMQLLAE